MKTVALFTILWLGIASAAVLAQAPAAPPQPPAPQQQPTQPGKLPTMAELQTKYDDLSHRRETTFNKLRDITQFQEWVTEQQELDQLNQMAAAITASQQTQASEALKQAQQKRPLPETQGKPITTIRKEPPPTPTPVAPKQ